MKNIDTVDLKKAWELLRLVMGPNLTGLANELYQPLADGESFDEYSQRVIAPCAAMIRFEIFREENSK
jgi:hypothetical protein